MISSPCRCDCIPSRSASAWHFRGGRQADAAAWSSSCTYVHEVVDSLSIPFEDRETTRLSKSGRYRDLVIPQFSGTECLIEAETLAVLCSVLGGLGWRARNRPRRQERAKGRRASMEWTSQILLAGTVQLDECPKKTEKEKAQEQQTRPCNSASGSMHSIPPGTRSVPLHV